MESLELNQREGDRAHEAAADKAGLHSGFQQTCAQTLQFVQVVGGGEGGGVSSSHIWYCELGENGAFSFFKQQNESGVCILEVDTLGNSTLHFCLIAPLPPGSAS